MNLRPFLVYNYKGTTSIGNRASIFGISIESEEKLQ